MEDKKFDPWPRRLLWTAITCLLVLYLVCLLLSSGCTDDECYVVDEKCIIVTIDDAVQAVPIDAGVDAP